MIETSFLLVRKRYRLSNTMYLLTEWEGRTGKYLARGQDVRTSRIFGSRSGRTDLAALGPYVLTESQIFSRPARPYSVNKHFII